jgi:hypothetical protein
LSAFSVSSKFGLYLLDVHVIDLKFHDDFFDPNKFFCSINSHDSSDDFFYAKQLCYHNNVQNSPQLIANSQSSAELRLFRDNIC